MIALAKFHAQRALPPRQLSSIGEDATTSWRPMRKLPVPPVAQSPDLAANHSVLGTAPHLWNFPPPNKLLGVERAV
jgi:hypothetical protein